MRPDVKWALALCAALACASDETRLGPTPQVTPAEPDETAAPPEPPIQTAVQIVGPADMAIVLDGAAWFGAVADAPGASWSLMEEPSIGSAAISDPQNVVSSFEGSAIGRYVVEFSADAIDAQRVEIQLRNAGPLAVAVAPARIPRDTGAVLDSSGSSDPNGDAITAVWSVVSSPAGSIAVPLQQGGDWTFVPDRAGIYVLDLKIQDSGGASSSATVELEATRPVIVTKRPTNSFDPWQSFAQAGGVVAVSGGTWPVTFLVIDLETEVQRELMLPDTPDLALVSPSGNTAIAMTWFEDITVIDVATGAHTSHTPPFAYMTSAVMLDDDTILATVTERLALYRLASQELEYLTGTFSRYSSFVYLPSHEKVLRALSGPYVATVESYSLGSGIELDSGLEIAAHLKFGTADERWAITWKGHILELSETGDPVATHGQFTSAGLTTNFIAVAAPTTTPWIYSLVEFNYFYIDTGPEIYRHQIGTEAGQHVELETVVFGGIEYDVSEILDVEPSDQPDEVLAFVEVAGLGYCIVRVDIEP